MLHLDRHDLARQLLQRLEPLATPEAGGGTELSLRIDEAIDAALAQESQGHTRRVTILLSDLRGFTALAQRCTALQMMETLNRYLGRMTRLIVDHGGTIDKFMGDAIMALFGAPLAMEDDVASALACAIEMQIAMDDLNLEHQRMGLDPLYMGIGINTGEVVAGRLGSKLHSEYTVIGDEVNLASRIEAHSLRGQILISENTWQLARDYVEVGDVNEVKVKGRSGTVRMMELLGTRHPHPLNVPRRDVRRSVRVEVDQPIRFQVIRGKSVESQDHAARVVDLSYGGLRMVCEEPLDPFTDIRLSLLLSVLSAQATDVYGKVLRVEPSPGGYTCQVSFTSIEAAAQQAIKDYVDATVQAKTY